MKKISAYMFAAIILVSTHAISQETTKQKTINVSGTAEMEVTPDEIYVLAELREYDKKGGSKADIEVIKSDFLNAATSIGIDAKNISVQSYQGWDGNYWIYKRNKKNNPNLKASITYQIKLSNTKKMDELVQKLDDEATQNFYISRVSHSLAEQFKKQLKIEAVKAAKEKAIYLAEAIGEKAGEAITINEPNEMNIGYPVPVYGAMRMKAQVADAAEPAPEVDFKKIKLKFEVNAVFALK